MATKSELLSASGLQMSKNMLRVAVAILAMLSTTGCGVGADESYDGQTLVTSGGQALIGTPDSTPAVEPAQVPETPVTATPSTVKDPGTIALPQDPIPVLEGRTAMPMSPFGTPAPVPVMPPKGY
jgi:hypothetical protein